MRSNRTLVALAVGTLWFINGLVTGSLSAKLPELAQGLNLSDGSLGLALLGQTIGLIVVMFFLADRLVKRFGPRRVAIVAAATYCISFALPGYAGGVGTLFAALLVIGVFNAPLDVTMAGLGGELEERWQRRVMSKLEFGFNAGLLLAAGFAWLGAERFGVSSYLTIIAGLSLVLVLLAAPLLPDSTPDPEDGKGDGAPVVNGPVTGSPGSDRTPRPRFGFTPAIGGLALLAAGALWCEATVLDWMGIYFVRTLDAEPADYAVGLLCFVVGLMASLWGGNRLADRFGPVRVVVVGGLAFAVGILVTLLAGNLPAAYAGLLVAGAGMANAHPLALSKAQRIGGPTVVARVGGTSYVGLVVAKPAIGVMAELTSLQIALLSSVLLALAMVAAARVLRPEEEAMQPATDESAAVVEPTGAPETGGSQQELLESAAVVEPTGAPETGGSPEELLVSYSNRPGEVVVVADLSGSNAADVTGALVLAVSALTSAGASSERVLVSVARRTNPSAPGRGIAVDAAFLARIRASAGSIEGIANVGEPVVDFVVDRGWRAVLAVVSTRDTEDEALEACAESVAAAVPELAEILVCREVGGGRVARR